MSLILTTAAASTQAIEELVKKYKTVGGLLRKIEELVTGTNNGKAPQLAGYYAYWERSIFTALNNMVLTAMRTLVNMLVARSAKKAAAAGLPARPPLFKVLPLTLIPPPPRPRFLSLCPCLGQDGLHRGSTGRSCSDLPAQSIHSVKHLQ